MGKTELLDTVCERARCAGALVLRAEADRLESDCPFGVARQLFDGADGIGGIGRVEGIGGIGGAGGIGLYEFHERAMALERDRPLVIAVDELRFVDDASARWLAYLLRRIGRRRVLVIATTGLPTDAIDIGLLSRFEHEITLHGLRVEAIVELAGRVLGTPVEKEFGTACHEATDGNPWLATTLLRAVRESGAGQPVSPEALPGLLASPPAPLRSRLRRTLATCGPGAAELARAIAAFGEPVELDLAAAATDLTTTRIAPLVEALAAARLLHLHGERAALRPPMVQAAVLAGLAPGVQQALRATAARLLHARGAPAADIAAQLLHSDPLGERWAADVLCAVAARARAEHDADRVLELLGRALREPMGARRRAELMVRMGSAQPPADIDSAVGYLRRALDVTTDIPVRAGAARRLAGLLCLSGRHQEGVRVLRDTADSARGRCPGTAASLDVDEALHGLCHPPAPAAGLTRLADRASEPDLETGPKPGPKSGPEAEHAAVGVQWSVRAMLAGRQRQRAVELVSRALDRDLPHVDEASLQHPMGVLALAVAGELDRALHHADQEVGRARGTRSALGGARALAMRSEVNYRLGRLEECRNDARACRDTLAQFDSHPADGPALAATARLADALMDSGDLDAAGRVLDGEPCGATAPTSLPGTWLLVSRGRLHLARGETWQGVEVLLETGRWLESWRVSNPALIPWRSLAARGQAALGRHRRARELIEEELALAREWGSARAIGVALRAAGTTARGSAGAALLREAVATLCRSGATLEYARALTDLGTALRRTNQLADARHYLRQAATSAERCGAVALVRHARAELIAAGGRPRGQVHCGVESLTPAERRVAALAAQGMNNREISESLFVVRRTVELHLSSIYRKLGVRGRAELPGTQTLSLCPAATAPSRHGESPAE